MAEEPSLPRLPLPGVSWDENTQSFSNNPKKRGRGNRKSSPYTGPGGPSSGGAHNSSDPAVFSSDDDPALDNYVGEGRRKKRYVGSWFQQQPAVPSSDSAFGGPDDDVITQPKGPQRRTGTLARKLDSGVFLGSDCSSASSEDDFVLPAMETSMMATRPKVVRPPTAAAAGGSSSSAALALASAQRRLKQRSEAERRLQDEVRRALDNGDETVDFWNMGLTELSGETVAPLAQFECIPQVTRDVAFEQRDPELKVYLAQNRLTRLPGALFDLEHLAILSLRGNALEELPPAIGRLSNLQELNVSQNRLRHLPVELLDLMGVDGRLRTLIIHPNPFLRPNAGRDVFEILEDGGPGVFDDYDLDMEPDAANEDDFVHPPAVPEDRLPRLMTRRLGRSPVQVSDAAGRIQSAFRLPDSGTEPVEVETIFPRRLVSYGGVTGEQDGQEDHDDEHSGDSAAVKARGTKVPSLVEAVMRSCARSAHLSDLRDVVPDEHTGLGRLLDRALAQRECGGLVCSRCRRAVVVPALEWIEWREVSTPTKFRRIRGKYRLDPLSEVDDELVVPFLHRACSERCGPRRESSGWEFPRGCEGMTVGYCLYNGVPEGEEGAGAAA